MTRKSTKGQTWTQGWYYIQDAQGWWFSSIRPVGTWGKVVYTYSFSPVRSDALAYRRSATAGRMLRQIIRRYGPGYYIIKEESAGAQALKKRQKKAANANPS